MAVMLMVKRILAAPFRMVLGLPPTYGLTVKCRVLQLLRMAGVYRGRIDFVAMARPVKFGIEHGG